MEENELNKHLQDGFKLPKEYFENLEATIFEKLEQPESRFPKNDGMLVPDQYFENFEDRLFDKLDTPPVVKVVTLSPFKKYYFTISATAAAVILLFVAFYTFSNNEDTLENLWAEVEESDIESYFETHIKPNSYEVAEVFNEETVEHIEITQELYNEEEMTEFIDNNFDEYDDLIFED